MARRTLFGAFVAAIALALAGPAGACSSASFLVSAIKGGPSGSLKAYPGSTITVVAEGLNPTHGSLNLIMEGAVVATSAMQVAYEAGSKEGSAVFTFVMQAAPRPEPYVFTVAAANGSQDAGLGSLRTAVTVVSAPAPQPAPQPTPTEPGGSNGGASPQPQPPAVAPPPAPSVSTPTVATPTSTPATQATPTAGRAARVKKATPRRATPAPAVVPNPAVGEDVPAESGVVVEAPVASPVPADEEGLAWWILALAAFGIFLLGAAAGGLAVRRRRGTEPTDLPPVMVDLDAELERLLAEGETQAPEPAEKR